MKEFNEGILIVQRPEIGFLKETRFLDPDKKLALPIA
jgi:hypothetical protein